MRFFAVAAGLALVGCAVADDDAQAWRIKESYWSFESGFNEGKPWIGSEDARTGSIWKLSYVKPESRFRYKSNPAQAVYSVYYMPTRTSAFDGHPANTMDTFGVQVGARYWNEWIPGVNMFFDLGWGLAYNQRTTQDLPNQINSTPYFGVGTMFAVGHQELIFAIRWHHMSNGASNNDNQGFNAIQYSLGVRF
ncbi:MAG: acyloxyacyl hydrolase [Armatimonadetes bacterium]|nr:acyloxyacyl hydrolase [Armatimonadota bacterium]MBX3107694.1 acyloxyacyl hydrolase [Fimbriimonadaceae bacterium]